MIKYLCTFTNTIADVLANRGWKEVTEEEAWDFVWADREWVYAVFDKVHLEHWQRLNHFRNGKELCRKDLMAKNIKKKRCVSRNVFHSSCCALYYSLLF